MRLNFKKIVELRIFGLKIFSYTVREWLQSPEKQNEIGFKK